MERFFYEVTVERTVIDTVSVAIDAEDEVEAYKILEKASLTFPEPLDHNRIKYMYIENRKAIGANLLDVERKESV